MHGQCVPGACRPNRGDCDLNPGNGCETNTLLSSRHCGFCGYDCNLLPGAIHGVCEDGQCVVERCLPGLADCDEEPSNGCEQPLNTPGHCGACEQPCGDSRTTASCWTGACAILACAPNHADCDGSSANGCEANLHTSENNCGFCGNRCQPPNASGRCMNGLCWIGRCNAGWLDCDRNPSNGCESSGPCGFGGFGGLGGGFGGGFAGFGGI
ncbi:MAG: hypothetical protein MJD61_19150 [Proteobacteria bacterium]|nr:hypothetical protein [Pseudomonadota bacterium]